jgi:glutathione S-transferase
MKLHVAPSPNALRVEVFMQEKGIEPFVSQTYDLRSGDNLSAEFRQMNPFGRVPVLELDDGTFLAESVAICRYLEGLHPEPALFGSTPLELAQVEMWNRRAELNFMLPAASSFRNLSGFFKDREKICEEWGLISAEVAAAALAVFDEHLASSTFLAGDAFSVADITFAIAVNFAERVQVDLPYDLPNIARYRQTVAARPSFATG